MENDKEKSPERILTKAEVMEVISRFTEKGVVVNEKSDEQGLYLLEVKVEGNNPGEITQYEYRRKGEIPGGHASEKSVIHVVFYEGDMPVGGNNVAELNEGTGEWEFV